MNLATDVGLQLPLVSSVLGVGAEAGIIREYLDVICRDQFVSMLAKTRSLEDRFIDAATRWEEATGHLSSIQAMALDPNYQRIIGMGQAVVPFLLREMELRPNHWHWALNAITGEDPVPPDHEGALDLVSQDWLAWGRAQGYLW
jgi:hypothetical protein